MAQDPRWDLLGQGQDQDILLRDRDETLDASVRDRDKMLVRLETVSRPRRRDWDRIPGNLHLLTYGKF